MVNLRRALVAVLLLALSVFAWLWFTRARRVDMAAYAPADSIIYAETDSLPAVFDAFTSSDAWRELAPAAGVGARPAWTGWLPGFVSFTGLGTADAVVLSRAQVAVAVLGFQAAEESETTLKLSPRVALVAETHTSEWRVKGAVESLVGDFARRTLGAPPLERKEVDGVPFYLWAEQGGGRRKLVAAVEGSVAVVGNDEGAVRACLDVRRGARPSLAGDGGLKEMRARLGGEGALAFGYAPRGSLTKGVEVFAPAFVGGVSQEPQIQSVMATLLPQLVDRTLGDSGWAARAAGGGVEDVYFVTLAGGVSERLRAPLALAGGADDAEAAALPADAHQVSFYDFRSPEEAYRGTGAALSSQLDVAGAALVTLGLRALVKPFGVENPREFLGACGPRLATARLGAESEGKVLVAHVRDRAALREQALARVGRGARAEREGDVELLVSSDPERGAAAFAGDLLLMGSEEDVRRCLEARRGGRTLREAEALKAAPRAFLEGGGALVRTLADDRESARAVLARFGGRASAGQLEGALARRGYSVSESRLADTGFEKRTRSAFGVFGELVTRLAPR
ncbi:MAG TPA: hypothetical protein VF668_17860 [Pyrinomonadaceae bacterium]|jgi:hypothetical protein